jgi:hypothetical protein
MCQGSRTFNKNNHQNEKQKITDNLEVTSHVRSVLPDVYSQIRFLNITRNHTIATAISVWKVPAI